MRFDSFCKYKCSRKVSDHWEDSGFLPPVAHPAAAELYRSTFFLLGNKREMKQWSRRDEASSVGHGCQRCNTRVGTPVVSSPACLAQQLLCCPVLLRLADCTTDSKNILMLERWQRHFQSLLHQPEKFGSILMETVKETNPLNWNGLNIFGLLWQRRKKVFFHIIWKTWKKI